MQCVSFFVYFLARAAVHTDIRLMLCAFRSGCGQCKLTYLLAFSALTLLVGQQEEHPVLVSA